VTGVQTCALPIYFLHIANLTAVKDQKTLIDTFNILVKNIECALIIVGADYLKGKIQKYVKKLNLENNIKFIGPVAHTELPKYFRNTHILLHTSLYESQGLVIAEALATNTLVCGTNVGLIADLEDHCCIKVETGDYTNLAQKILYVLKNKIEFEKITKAGLNRSDKYDASITANSYKKMYNNLIENYE